MTLSLHNHEMTLYDCHYANRSRFDVARVCVSVCIHAHITIHQNIHSMIRCDTTRYEYKIKIKYRIQNMVLAKGD